MKRLYVSLVLIALLVVLCCVHTIHLSRFTDQLTGLLTQAQERVEHEDWDSAIQLTKKARDQWVGHEGYLHITLHHTDIDAVLVSFDETLAFLRGNEHQPAEYAAANARLITQLGLLIEAELPTITNLL